MVRVCDDATSADFLINPDGDTFTALSDKRYTLAFINNPTYKPGFIGFVYRRPDGTTVYYPTANTNHDFRSDGNAINLNLSMSEIVYPNGLTYYIKTSGSYMTAPLLSVTTNTGFQLKYISVIHNFHGNVVLMKTQLAYCVSIFQKEPIYRFTRKRKKPE